METTFYLFVYGTEAFPTGLDELEDEIFCKIEGQGDVTGTGSGRNGWNIDIEFESKSSANFILYTVIETLRNHGVGDSVTFDCGGRKEALINLERRNASGT